MNWDRIEGMWQDVTGRVQSQWGELTDDDIEAVRGDRRELVGKIQHRYGVTREEAERQVDDWLAAS